jgi:hypothetical protein
MEVPPLQQAEQIYEKRIMVNGKKQKLFKQKDKSLNPIQ